MQPRRILGQGLLSSNGELESHDGYSIYAGAVFPMPFNARLGLEYNWDMASAGSLVGRVNFHYEDEQYHDVVNVDQNLEDSFTQTDLTLTWRSADKPLFAQAFWRHIEDDDVRTTIFQTPIGALSSYAAPESYGLRVGYTFE